MKPPTGVAEAMSYAIQHQALRDARARFLSVLRAENQSTNEEVESVAYYLVYVSSEGDEWILDDWARTNKLLDEFQKEKSK